MVYLQEYFVFSDYYTDYTDHKPSATKSDYYIYINCMFGIKDQMKQSTLSTYISQQYTPPLLIQYDKISKNSQQKKYFKLFLPVNNGIKISSISCGLNFTVILCENLQLYSFGDNKYGQLGYSNTLCTQNFQEPRLIKFNNSSNRSFYPTAVRCGFSHVVVFNQKQIYGWGQCQYGALGYEHYRLINQWMPRKLPILVSNHQKVVDISCGNNTTIFNISDDFYGIGDNRHGQLGVIAKKPITQPQKISINPLKSELKRGCRLVKVKGGDKFSVGIDENGNLYGVGQLIKLGLHGRNQSALGVGLSRIEQLTSSGYSLITNIQDLWCGQDLLIKNNKNNFVYYGNNKKYRLKLQNNCGQMQVNSLARHIVQFKHKQSAYQWNIIEKQSKSYFYMDLPQELQQNALDPVLHKSQYDLVNMQADGSIVYLSTQQQQSLLLNNTKCGNSHSQLEDRVRYNKQYKYDKYEDIESGMYYGQNKSKNRDTESTIINENRNNMDSNRETKQLKKQISEQKQIIRLYQQYVNKLQIENKLLKHKIDGYELKSNHQLDNEEDYDSVNKTIFLLKSMLKDMIHLTNK